MRVSSLMAALLVGSVLLVWAPPAAAATEGTLYFTSDVASSVTPSPTDPTCVTDNTYKAATDVPAAGKAPIGLTSFALACPFWFDWTATEDFTFTSDTTALAYIGCDSAGTLLEVDFHLSVAGEEIDPDRHSTQWIPTVQCTGAGFSQEVKVTIATADTPVAAGDLVHVEMGVWAQSPPPGAPAANFHVITGPEMPSGLTAVGIPTPATVGTESINLAAGKSTASALPGASAFYDLTIRNLGSATKFTLSSSGLPNGYAAAFNPLSGDMAAGSNATSQLKVTIPSSATGGTSVNFKVMVTGSGGANKSVDLKLEVAKPATSGGPGPSGGTGPSGGGPTGGETSNDGFTSEGETSGDGSNAAPGIEFAFNVLAIGLLVVAMRRRNLR